MNIIKTIIVDDEKDARRGIKKLLSNDSDIVVTALCKNGIEAIETINRDKPDLVFLDIQMPQVTGFDVLQSISQKQMPVIVFVTAYDQYSLQAFEVHALDYILKPFTDKRFYDALQNAKKHINNTSLLHIKDGLSNFINQLQNSQNQINTDLLFENHPQKLFKDKIVIRSSGKIFLIKIDDIEWVEAYDYYVKIHVKDKFYLLRETMTNMETRLPSNIFVRIHKSSIVKIDQIVQLEAAFNGNYIVLLSNGKKLTLSASYYKKLSPYF